MKSDSKKQRVFVVLCDVRSVHNVGSVFRTADCLGVSDIVLVGLTPTPLDRFGRPRKDFIKVSLGAETSVPWRYFKTVSQALAFLKKRQAHIVAVEQSPRSVDYKKIKPRYPVAFVFGNEVRGISVKTLAQCDTVAEIPMRGAKESLNVSVAVGIALSRILGR